MSNNSIIDIVWKNCRGFIIDYLNSIKKWTGSRRGSSLSKTHFSSAYYLFLGCDTASGVSVSLALKVWETLRNKFERGAPVFLKTSVIVLLCSPDLTVWIAATQLENLDAMRISGSGSGQGQALALNLQRQGGRGYCKGQQTQSSNGNCLTRTDLCCWLVIIVFLEVT